MTSAVRIRLAQQGDVSGLMALESRYYVGNLDPAERGDGFMSVLHPEHWWDRVIEGAGVHVAVTADDVVAGFMVVLPPPDPTEPGLPAVTKALLDLAETVEVNGKPIAQQRYALHGPSCIAEEMRGQGVYSSLHAVSRDFYRDRFDVGVLFVAADNPRSLHTTSTRLGARALAEFDADGRRFHFLAFEF